MSSSGTCRRSNAALVHIQQFGVPLRAYEAAKRCAGAFGGITRRTGRNLAHTESLANTYEVWLCCVQEGAAPVDKGLDVIHVQLLAVAVGKEGVLITSRAPVSILHSQHAPVIL